MRKSWPFISPCPSATMEPNFWRNSLTMTPESSPFGALIAVMAPLGLAGANNSSPSAPQAARVAAASCWALSTSVSIQDRPGRFDDLTDGSNVVRRAGRAFRRLDEYAFGIRVRGQSLCDRCGLDHLSVGGGEDHRIQAEGLAQFHPALAKFAGRAHDHAVSRREAIGNRGFHRAGARGGQHQRI